MGIDIYMNWDNQTEDEHNAQITGFSTDAGAVGYLREAYHGGPYVTRFFVQEAFEDDEARLAWENDSGGADYKGAPIPSARLFERLPAAIVMAVYRNAMVYGEKEEPWIVDERTPGAPPPDPNAPPPTQEDVEQVMQSVKMRSKLRDVFAGIEIMKGGGDEKVFAAGIPEELLEIVRKRIEIGKLPNYCQSFVDFARLAEAKEKQHGKPVLVYASY